MTELRIYFSGALRGGASFPTLRRRIAFLETLGEVTTRHMASPATADLGAHGVAQSDAAIYAHDQRLLETSHLFVADLSAPSTGAGFMAACAVAAKLPALCLFAAGQKPSAMIAGCPAITTSEFGNDADFERAVRGFVIANADKLGDVRSRAPRIFLAGPPGSGKGTLGAALAAATGAPHVSSGELLRAIVADGRHPRSAAIADAMGAGQLVGAEIMLDIVIERLTRADCRLAGVILDGYPPSLADLDNLRAHGIAPDIVFYLDCADATAIARQVGRGARSTDNPDKARTRMATFHDADAGFDALATRWYPDRIVARLDAERSPADVERDALASLADLFGATTPERSFFPLPPHRADTVRSTRFHYHVDAPDIDTLRAIARAIYARDKRAQGQLKIYPIESLHLAAQAARLPVYRRLPNFHTIQNADTEAFITGRLGDGDDAMFRTVLEVAHKYGAMAELEQYTGEWTLRTDGSVVADTSYDLLPWDADAFAELAEHAVPDVPAWELHLGFDVAKANGVPLALADLAAACSARGIDNGGWFIFKNTVWAYRSNEFSSLDQAQATSKLQAQAHALRAILAEASITADVTFSLERVHGIWTFKPASA